MSSVAIFAVRTTQLAKASNIDPYDGVAASRSEVDLRRLHHALRLQLKILRGSLIPESLHRISSPYFRYCRKCLHRGHHGVVHQLETVTRCPIHGTLLEVECCECRAKTPYQLSANLLDAPIDVDAVATCMDPALCPLERNSLLAKGARGHHAGVAESLWVFLSGTSGWCKQHTSANLQTNFLAEPNVQTTLLSKICKQLNLQGIHRCPQRVIVVQTNLPSRCRQLCFPLRLPEVFCAT